MSQPFIITNTEEAIATITLNRPEKRNALNGEMIKALIQALHNIAPVNVSQKLSEFKYG